MALDRAMIDDGRNPVPLPFEMNIKSLEGAELSLTIPDNLPLGSAVSGGSGGVKKQKATGRIWLTDQRFVFISDISKSGKTPPPFNTLSVPLSSIVSTSFQQPLLGSNFLVMTIYPSPDGGLTEGTKAELRCSGRLFEFTAALDKTREVALEAMRTQDPEIEEGLREQLDWDTLTTYSTNDPPSAIPGPSTATDGALDPPPAYS